MRRELAFLPQVSTDFDEVWNYYEQPSPRRGGDRFQSAYRELLEQIKAGVVTHRIAFGAFHRAFIPRYPYILYYRIIDDRRAVIVALLYARFDPEKTKDILRRRK
jgi:plasmid stabilization system protein ParE